MNDDTSARAQNQAGGPGEAGKSQPEVPEGETPLGEAAIDASQATAGTEEFSPEVDEAERLRAERDLARDQQLRLAADFDNYRKRTEGRLRGRWARAQANLVSRLLEPLDDLQRVSAWNPDAPASAEAVVEGASLVEQKFFRILKDIGVDFVDPTGERFDPNTMEAMMRVTAESEEDDDLVERVFQRGYVLEGQLIRPARVSVFKVG